MSEDRPSGEEPPSDRRSFLRRLTGEAVNAAGTLAGTTQIVIRSASAASEAAAEGLGIRQPSDPPPTAADPAASTAAAPPPGAATPARASPPDPVAGPAPLRPLTERETALLAATTAVIAVNGADGAPHLTRAPFHWDGEVARLLGQLFGARIANVQRDGRVSVLVGDATGWLTLIGEARVVTGAEALAEARPLLAHLHAGQPADQAWASLNAAGDQAVIVLRPARIVSQPG